MTKSREIFDNEVTFVWGALGGRFKAKMSERPMAGGPVQSTGGAEPEAKCLKNGRAEVCA